MNNLQIIINGEKREYFQESLLFYMQAKNITPTTGGVAVAVNNNVIPRSQWASFIPKPSDTIEIITAVSGG
ncbi:MAG: sulfur carrier protein ThiS [Alphaproteobacteria bacterium]|nr:MAG: sulfur carrier protein ThiS [Alphaproteobacteria bacterium]